MIFAVCKKKGDKMKLEIIEKFKNEFKNITELENQFIDAQSYYSLSLSRKKNLNVTPDEKKEIIKHFDFLKQYNQIISNFLGNQNYDTLVKENENEYMDIINYVKKIQIENGLLIEKYQRIINARPSLFMNYFNGKIEKYGTYDRDICCQFRESIGYNKNDNYSISEFYKWVTMRKIVGNSLITKLQEIELKNNLHFIEINKGLYDSLFIGNKNWKLVTPNSYTFDSLDKDNIIRGKLVYECGIQIKDNYKTLNVPNNIDTIVLHNPYSEDEIETLLSASTDYNIVLSFYGLKNDLDYSDKLELYTKYLAMLRENKSSYVEEDSKVSNKQYIHTMISYKK